MHKLKIQITQVAVLILLFSTHFLASAKAIGNSTLSFHGAGHTGSEYLDGEQKYLISWNINDAEKIIYFEVTAQTLGYVGFGVSPTGGMTGADILIAGLYENGTGYSGVSTNDYWLD